jgi:uncharacterized protein
MNAITIFITRDCNFNCKYCIHKRENKKISLQLAKKVADFAYENGVKNISFFGGEPLLNFKGVKKIINYSNKKGYGFKFALITNGYLLTKSKLNYLVKNNVQLAISFDGEFHNNYRVTVKGKQTTNKVLKNLLNAVKRVEFDLCSVVNKNNIEGLADDYISLYERGITSIKPAINEEFGEWTDDEIYKLKQEYLKIINYVTKKRKENKSIIFSDIFNMAEVKILNNGGFINVCPFGEGGVVVDDVGNLYPCTQFVFNENNNVGNIYSGINFDKLNALKMQYCTPIFSECLTCDANWVCHYNCACKNYTYKIKGKNKTDCKYIKMKIQLVNELVDRYKGGNYGSR